MAFIHPNHKLSHLLSIFCLICSAPSKICNSLRICREVACSIALIPSVNQIKRGLCEGAALGERTNWASLGAYHSWGLSSLGLSTLFCIASFPKYGRREKWGSPHLCGSWVRQNVEESVLTRDPNIWVIGTLQWKGNEGLSIPETLTQYELSKCFDSDQ